jgi:hypothetical protein
MNEPSDLKPGSRFRLRPAACAGRIPAISAEGRPRVLREVR